MVLHMENTIFNTEFRSVSGLYVSALDEKKNNL